MRITGGKYSGRTISFEKGLLDVRPAMDRMRESIFSILGDLEGFAFCDLFSGSGIIALEAASRGAKHIVAVEKDAQKRANLIKNMSIVEEHIEVKIIAVELYLMRCKESFDICFCDPPFPYKWKADLLSKAGAGTFIKEGGLFVMHHPKEDRFPEKAGVLQLEDTRAYGRSIVKFYRHVKS